MISSVVIISFLVDLKPKNKQNPATQDPSEGRSCSSETNTSQPTLLDSQPIPSISPEVLHNPGLYLYNCDIFMAVWQYRQQDKFNDRRCKSINVIWQFWVKSVNCIVTTSKERFLTKKNWISTAALNYWSEPYFWLNPSPALYLFISSETTPPSQSSSGLLHVHGYLLFIISTK